MIKKFVIEKGMKCLTQNVLILYVLEELSKKLYTNVFFPIKTDTCCTAAWNSILQTLNK